MSYEDFVVVQQEVAVDQAALITKFDIWVGTLDPEIRPALEPLLENYRNRHRVMISELFPAALGTDEAAYQAAISKYQSYSLPQNSEAAIRSLITHPIVAAAIEAEGVDPEAMVDSLMRTFGG